MRGHGGTDPGTDPGRPAAGHGLDAGVEAYPFHAMHIMVAEQRTLPAAKTVKGHGHGNGHIDAHHARLHLVGEGARRVSIAGKDGYTVAILVLFDQLERLLKFVDSQHGKHGTKNFFAIDAHIRGDMIEQAGSNKKTIAFGQRVLSLWIDEELRSFLH